MKPVGLDSKSNQHQAHDRNGSAPSAAGAIQGGGELRDPLSVLLEELPEHVFFKDVQGRYTRVSRSLARFYGRSIEEILGATDFDFYPREDAEQYRADELRIIETGEGMLAKEVRCVVPRREPGGSQAAAQGGVQLDRRYAGTPRPRCPSTMRRER